MAYTLDDGEKGAVQNEQYCMPSWNKTNTDSMNQMSGYHETSDLANVAKQPTEVPKTPSNVQLGPQGANPMRNDAKGKAY